MIISGVAVAFKWPEKVSLYLPLFLMSFSAYANTVKFSSFSLESVSSCLSASICVAIANESPMFF